MHQHHGLLATTKHSTLNECLQQDSNNKHETGYRPCGHADSDTVALTPLTHCPRARGSLVPTWNPRDAHSHPQDPRLSPAAGAYVVAELAVLRAQGKPAPVAQGAGQQQPSCRQAGRQATKRHMGHGLLATNVSCPARLGRP
jgi:hypothetical protein